MSNVRVWGHLYPHISKSLSLKQFSLGMQLFPGATVQRLEDSLDWLVFSSCVFNSAPVTLGPNHKSTTARLRCVNPLRWPDVSY